MPDFDLQSIAHEKKNSGPSMFEWLRIIFFIVTMILIPLTKAGWRQGWLFVAWGVVIGGFIHTALLESYGDVGHAIALPIYAVFLTLGILYWRWRYNDNKLMERMNNPTKPSAPREMYDN
ncbi:MAG: hypothetical protein FWC97_04295 [Treponema sp.]|nr:hypothetical protein [Treponema sp.]